MSDDAALVWQDFTQPDHESVLCSLRKPYLNFANIGNIKNDDLSRVNLLLSHIEIEVEVRGRWDIRIAWG